VAQKIAKSKLLLGFKKIHKDYIFKFKMLSSVDNCADIKYIVNWEIELSLENDYI